MKKIKIVALGVVLLFSIGCQRHFYASKSQNTYYVMDEELGISVGEDSVLMAMLNPYRDTLVSKMGGTIGQCFADLEKGFLANSDLGNWMSDVMLEEGQPLSSKPIDFSIINHGSMRIPMLKKGPIKRGTIYELMPFDNILWVLELNGEVVSQLFDHMALNKGWGISQKSHYEIIDKKAHNIVINGESFDVNKSYRVILADYLAKGGDNCRFLKGQPKEELGVLLRDALLNNVEKHQEKGEAIGLFIEKRVIKK